MAVPLCYDYDDGCGGGDGTDACDYDIIPANSPSFGRSLRLFHLTEISVGEIEIFRILTTV